MNIKEIIENQKTNIEGYLTNIKKIPILKSKPQVFIKDSASDLFNAIKEQIVINNSKKMSQEIDFILAGDHYYDDLIDIEYLNIIKKPFKFDETTDEITWKYLDDCVNTALKTVNYSKPIIIIGHTHPCMYALDKEGNMMPQKQANCWSKNDLITCYNIASHYKYKVNVAYMLITPSLDINTLCFVTEKDNEGFYRFDKVYTKAKGENINVLEPSYNSITKPFAEKETNSLEKE